MSCFTRSPVLDACDVLHHAVGHLAQQFRPSLSYDQAKANLQAQAVLVRLQYEVLDGAELSPELWRIT